MKDDIKELLYADLPKEAVKQHPTKTYLSSIKAIYVTERFNEVFGVGKWSTKVSAEHTDFETGMIVVKLIFEVKELGIYYESFGGNDNGGVKNKNFDLGDAYKGASTDALTKIGSYLGVGIKVFKGLNDGQKNTPVSAGNDDKPWCNIGDASWNKALESGVALEELRKYRKVSNANGTEYLKQLTDKIK